MSDMCGFHPESGNLDWDKAVKELWGCYVYIMVKYYQHHKWDCLPSKKDEWKPRNLEDNVNGKPLETLKGLSIEKFHDEVSIEDEACLVISEYILWIRIHVAHFRTSTNPLSAFIMHIMVKLS